MIYGIPTPLLGLLAVYLSGVIIVFVAFYMYYNR